MLSMNSNAIPFIEKHFDYPFVYIDWYRLSKNSNAIYILEKHLNNPLAVIDWHCLSENPCDAAIKLLELYPEKINWTLLSANPKALHLLEKYPDRINWDMFSRNPNLLNAIHLLEKNYHRINWDMLSANPIIFEIDVKQTNLDTRKKANNIDYFI
jgi:hypothetical protein